MRENRMLRTTWRKLETELRDGLRHRKLAKAPGQQRLSAPVATAPVFDPTERRTEASPEGRLLRPDSLEVGEQRDDCSGGADGAKDRARGESGKPKHAPDTGLGKRVTSGRPDTAVRTTIRRQFNPREEPRALAGMRGSVRGGQQWGFLPRSKVSVTHIRSIVEGAPWTKVWAEGNDSPRYW